MRFTRRVAAAAALAAAVAMTFAGCGGRSGDGATTAKPDKLVLALVPSQNADTIVGTSKPLTDYLTQKLGIPVTATVTTDYTGAVTAIGSDQAQIAFLPVLPMEQAVDKFGATPLLQVKRDGKTTYHTQFFTNNPGKYCTDTPAKAGAAGLLYCNGTGGVADGPAALDAMAKLKGAKVAFVNQESASGYIFPMLDLINAGMTKDDVQADFTGGHDKAVIAVAKGQDEVGVSFDDARTIVKDVDVSKLCVFALSEEIPNDGVVTSKGLSPELTKQISDALIAFSGTDDGKKALSALYDITDFAPADPASLAIVKQAAEKVVGS